jgi:DNA invertase Pin-like site-specific DNA recombinase
MARYSGGPVTHRALTGPRKSAAEAGHSQEVLYTLACIQEVRAKIDRNELQTVKIARAAGLSWTDIATALGITRQSAWEKWRELDESAAT